MLKSPCRDCTSKVAPECFDKCKKLDRFKSVLMGVDTTMCAIDADGGDYRLIDK